METHLPTQAADARSDHESPMETPRRSTLLPRRKAADSRPIGNAMIYRGAQGRPMPSWKTTFRRCVVGLRRRPTRSPEARNSPRCRERGEGRTVPTKKDHLRAFVGYCIRGLCRNPYRTRFPRSRMDRFWSAAPRHSTLIDFTQVTITNRVIEFAPPTTVSCIENLLLET
jgi:hypothetical protein